MEYNNLRTLRNNDYVTTIMGNSNNTVTYNTVFDYNTELKSVTTYDDKVVMVFREKSNIYTNGLKFKDKVYKIIITSQDNKLIYSDKIYGSIVPASEEYFTFDD